MTRFSFVTLAALLQGAIAYVSREEPTPEENSMFLEKKNEDKTVISLTSGLKYKVLRAGTGTVHPNEDTPCVVDYKGSLVNDPNYEHPFDSSYARGEPITFAPNQVIKGWTEAMQKMVEGDKWELYIPAKLGYGQGGSPPTIPGGATLIFTMEIHSCEKNQEVHADGADDLDEPSVEGQAEANAEESQTDLMQKEG